MDFKSTKMVRCMNTLHPAFIRIGLFLSLFTGNLPGRGQAPANTLGSVTISSPTAAALGKFGDIPVGYHTGVPNIQVPFYTVEAGPLKLPIGLSYHGSGLKVMEPAGWVGAGWALDAGGVITRTVNGQPDEAGTAGPQQYGHYSQNGYNSYLYNTGSQDWQGFANGVKDGEPDLFFFNFGGYSGKFYFRDDRTPVLVPQQDLQIIPSYSGGRSIDYFTVVTPDGTKYIFGNSPNVTSGATPIETTNCYTQSGGAMTSPPTSSWYLNQVLSADNAFAINLSYQAENYGYYTLALFPIDGFNRLGPDGINSYSLAKNIMQGVRLSQISFPNGTVNFLPGAVRTDLCDNVQNLPEGPNTSATSLGTIEIHDGTGFCRNYGFHYSYFTASNTALPTTLTLGNTYSTDLQRLRLDSVNQSSCDASLQVPPYKFTYYNGTVPRRLSFGVDHWGYYNGADANTGMIPTIYVDGTATPGANRDAAFPAMMAGMLTRIDYPTGGYNSFDFESNSGLVAQTYTSYNVLAGIQLAGPIFHQQNNTYSDSQPCTSNGNQPVTLKIQTNCNYSGTVTIKDANNNPYFQLPFSNTSGTPGTDAVTTWTYPYGGPFNQFMPAGNYTVSVALNNGNQAPVGGVYVQLTQPISVTNYVETTLGGLRIKKITAADGLTSNDIVTNYSYATPGGTTTAVLYSVPTYAMRIRNDLIASVGYWSTTSGYQTTILDVNGCPGVGDYYLSPGTLRPMASVQGAPIGYQMVTVSQPGNGSSVYNYYTANNGYSSFLNLQAVNSVTSGSCDPSTPNYPPAPLPFDSKRGELYSEQHYDDNGKLLKDVYYYPVFDESPVLPTPAFIVKTRATSAGTMYLGTQYSLNTVKKVSMTTVEDDYGSTGGILTVQKKTYYGSQFHNQPTMTVTSTSQGDTLWNTMRYAADFRLPSCDAISDCSTEYNSTCSSCTATYNTTRSGCSGSSSCLTSAYLSYMQCNTNARTSYVNCRNVNYMSVSNSFGSCHLSAEVGADALLKPVLMLQDHYMNPVVETSAFRGSMLKQSSYVAYSANSTPANFPYPAKTQAIDLQAPSSAFTPAAVSGSSISTDSRYQDETTYSFASGNPLQVTGRNGSPTSYIWDYANNKPVAKAVNATVDQIAYTSFEADGNGSWSIASGLRDNTLAATGAISYNLANGPISRSGLNTGSSYVVSYWTKTGLADSVSGTTSKLQGKTINGWTYYEHTVKGVSSVIVSGTGNIDELRLYPSTAQMTTYTYNPGIGISSQCDVGNRITYYFYDPLGRLHYVKDQDGNIVKTIDYHYMGQ